MTNWMTPEVIAANGAVFVKLLTAILGMYTWEVIVTLWYDVEIITRKRPFKWPMIAYWVTKYSMFWANIGLAISSNVTAEIDCQPLYVFNQLVGNTAVGGASTLLMLRVIAIWNRNIYVVVPLVLLSLGQWAILLHSVSTLRVHYLPAVGQCVVDEAPQVFLQLLYLYTMIFDLIVLVLSTIGLLRLPGRSGSSVSTLWKLLNRDGLFFFIVAFTSNLTAVVIIMMNLNPVMNVICSVPAAAVSATVACRSFVRLSTFNEQPAVTGNSSNGRSRGHAAGNTHMLKKTVGGTTSYGGQQQASGVHVQMDTFVSHHNPSSLSFGAGDVEAGSMEKGVQPVHGYGDYDDDKTYLPK